MTQLAAYDRARVALAEATRVDEVMAVRDEFEHVKLYARQIHDRALLADATIIQMRAERRLGVLLIAAKEAGQISEGRRRKDDDASRVTLEEVGVDRKLSAKAQKAAGLEETSFDAMCQATRDKIKSGRAILVDPIDDRGIIHGARSIMSSRVEPDDSLDYFPTPPCATRALVELVFKHLGVPYENASAREPACGEGHIAEVLTEYFGRVSASDIFDYGYGEVGNFLEEHTSQTADWFITNPPFDEKAEAFLTRMLQLARVGVAMFVRLQWLEGEGRYERIFDPAMTPPTCVAFFSERIALCKGRWDPEGGTATAYIWLVWIKGHKPQAPFWIPPIVVDELTRPDDAERFTEHPVRRRVA
jgi:hypothetical protein